MSNKKIQDDRAEYSKKEMKEFTEMVAARDTFLSGWGGCEKGTSYCAWACKPEDSEKVKEWVAHRAEMERVAIRAHDYAPALGKNDKFHIYVVTEGHPALQSIKKEPLHVIQRRQNSTMRKLAELQAV